MKFQISFRQNANEFKVKITIFETMQHLSYIAFVFNYTSFGKSSVNEDGGACVARLC